MPPVLDDKLVARLAKLAARLDGGRLGKWTDDLAEFNRLAGTNKAFDEFQGIYGGESHADYVHRVLWNRALVPDPNLTRAEMTEIVSRIMAHGDDIDFYVALFNVNCQHPSGTDLIFWPNGIPELPSGRAATAAEIAQAALPDRA